MPIGTKEVEKIAELANLKFEAEELEPFVERFQEILDYFAKLQEVSTEGVEPTCHALETETLATPVRGDEVRTSLPVDSALANAPDRADNYFRVPAVIEE